MSSKNFMSYEDATTVLGSYANAIKNVETALADKQDVLLYGGVNPSTGADGDMYVKLTRDESTLIDMFGSPSAESTDDYEMSYTVDSSVMGDYYDYEAFGTGKGFGQNGRGSMTITYHFKNSKFKPANVSYCNNFNLSGGGYLESANFAIKASNDGTNWDTLYSTYTPCTRDTSVSADITTNTYYSYFKFEMNSGGGYTGIRNIVMNGISESYSNIDNIYFKNDGSWLKDAFAKKSDLDAKQDTLTFDDVPTANSSNPVKSGGVYSALADKQDALTAGNYISIANDGTINVTQGIGVYDVYSYEIKSINSGYATKITKRKNGVFVSEQDISNGTYSSENRLNVDDRFEFWYTFAGYLWHYKLLVDSNEHQKDEEVSWEYSTLVDYTETFNVSQDSSTDLATKGDIDAAISSAYHHAGTKTCAELVAGLLVAGNEGNVYNMTDSGTTTSDFIEGAGQPIKAGDNVGIAKISDGVYKFDLLSGFVDTTNFVQKSVTVGLLKNDGTVNDEIEGDVSSLKNGLTNLNNEVNGDATTYPYADVITIEDAVPANLADCNVKIEPVQDLHGYDKPWVGGAGKNKFNKDSSGNLANSRISTSQGNTYAANGYTVSHFIPITAGKKYVITTSNSFVSYYAWYTTNNVSGFITGNSINSGDYTTAPENAQYIRFDFKTTDADTVQIEEGQIATDYAPYENICPISGHTEASVQRDGKNQCPIAKMNTLNSDTFKLNAGTYTISFKMAGSGMYSTSSVILRDDSNADVLSVGVGSASSGTVKKGQFTLQSEKTLHLYVNNITASTGGYYIEDIQIELGQTVTTYVPYAGQTYTIALGDTIYGGTVRIDSNGNTVMDLDRTVIEYDGDSGENWLLDEGTHNFFYIELTGRDSTKAVIANNCVNAPISKTTADLGVGTDARYLRYRYADDNSLTVSDLKTYLASNNLQVCYYLATPFTVQLTPTQIQLLKGTNTLTASTGQISVTVNGVSGSIGQVQSEVNELAEDVADVQSDMDSLYVTATGNVASTEYAARTSTTYGVYTCPNGYMPIGVYITSTGGYDGQLSAALSVKGIVRFTNTSANTFTTAISFKVIMIKDNA